MFDILSTVGSEIGKGLGVKISGLNKDQGLVETLNRVKMSK
jgi:hypothetical protein